MARLFSSGFELNSVSDGVEWDINTGSPTISSTTVRSGTYAGRTSSLTSTVRMGWLQQFVSAASNGPFFYRFYFRYHVLPNVASTRIFVGLATAAIAGASSCSIRLTSTGTLQLWRSGNASQIGSDSAALTVDTWYRIEVQWDKTPAGGSQILNAFLDGTQFAGSSTETITNQTIAFMIGASLAAQADTAGDYFFDDVAVNNNTGSFQTSLPGVGQIIHLYPNAAGDNNAFTVQVGGTAGSANNFTRVKEVPPDDVTTYNAEVLSGDIDDFNIDNTPSSIASGDTINVIQVGIRYNAAVAAAEAVFNVRYKKTASGTVTSSANITPNSVTWGTNANAVPKTAPIVAYQDPDAGTITKATLDTSQIGYAIATTGTNAAQISTVWMLVDSTPVVVVATASTGFMTTNTGFWGT